MKSTVSVQNLQRTRKQMCIISPTEHSTVTEQKKSKFDEMVERLGNEPISKEETEHRRTKSEICLANGVQNPQTMKRVQEEDFFITEVIEDDDKPIYVNNNDTKSEEFVL